MAAIVLGTAAGGEPVAIPFFAAERATRAAVIGDPDLPRLLALRALSTGARVQVVTSSPEEWLRLRGSARRPAECMAVVPPGSAPPADASPAAPWMIIHDDPGWPAPAEPSITGPWQAVIAVPGAHAVTIAALRGLDAVILYRAIPAWRAAAVAAMNLPVPAALSLHGIPRDVVAVVASAATVKLVLLTPDASERALLHQSTHAHPPVPADAIRLAARRDAEPRWRIWRSNDRRLGSAVTQVVSFDTKNIRTEGEVA